MRLLIAVSSCTRDQNNGANESQRATFIPMLIKAGFDVRFFVGRGDTDLKEDEIRLDVDDSYIGLPAKTRESLRWALDNDYDSAFRIFTDTYICPFWLHKIDQERWTDWDFIGVIPKQPEPNGWFYAFGGGGYWTSRLAMQQIVKTSLPTPVTGVWETFAEDVWAGMALKPLKGLKWKSVTGLGTALEHLQPKTSTLHLSMGESTFENKTLYDVQWMYDAHSKVTECQKNLQKPSFSL